MIKISDGKLGVREFASIILLTVGIKFTDTTPGILFEKGKNAAWMMPFISFALICSAFLLLLFLLKKHELGLVELVNKLTGKYIGSVIVFLLFVFISFGTFINVRSYADIIDTLFFPNTPVPFIVFVIITVCFLIAIRGLETIGRTAWLLIPSVEFTVIILIVFVWKDLHWQHIFPIAGPGLKEVVKEGIMTSSVFGEIIILAAFYSFVRSYKEYRLASLVGFGLTSFKLIIYLLLYVMVFDYPTVQNMAYPYQQLTRFATVGKLFSHMEAVFLAFWLLASFVHFSIYLYLSAYLFAGIFRINEFEPLILPFSGLALYLALLPENVFQTLQYREFLLISGSGLCILLPICLWIVDQLKGWKNNEKT